jgi:hypothetical protein
VVTAGAGPTVSVTDLETGERMWELPGTQQPVGLATGRPAGRPVLAVSRWRGGLEVWDLTARVLMATAAVELEPSEWLHGVVHVGDGPAVVTSRGEEVRVRPLDGGAPGRLAPGGAEVVQVAVRDGDAPLAAIVFADATVSVIDVATWDVVDEHPLTLRYPATALCWAPDGDLLVACRRDILRLSR